jgi:hypothetical protein
LEDIKKVLKLAHIFNPRLAFSVGRTEVVSAKRHENGTLVQTGVSDYCK